MTAFLTILGLALVVVTGAYFFGKTSEKKQEIKNDAQISDRQRDVANQPAPSTDDTAGWLSGDDK